MIRHTAMGCARPSRSGRTECVIYTPRARKAPRTVSGFASGGGESRRRRSRLRKYGIGRAHDVVCRIDSLEGGSEDAAGSLDYGGLGRAAERDEPLSTGYAADSRVTRTDVFRAVAHGARIVIAAVRARAHMLLCRRHRADDAWKPHAAA